MAHIHEQIDFTVVIYVVHKDRVLLINHRELSRWLPIGGHVQLNEETDQALKRKINEECGLNVTIAGTKPDWSEADAYSLYTPAYMNIHKIDDQHRHIALVYFGRSDSDAVKEDPGEYSAYEWLTLPDLEAKKSDLRADVYFYAVEALQRLSS